MSVLDYGWSTFLNVASLPPKLRPWICDTYRLKQGLESAFSHSIQVNLYSNTVYFPQNEEALLIKDQKGWCREVYLQHDEIPLVYGRTLCNHQTYLNWAPALESLGTRGIGDTLLHSDPQIKRSPFEWSLILPQTQLFQWTLRAFNFEKTRSLFARRSYFYTQTGDFLIIEIFLPAFLERYS